MGGRKLTDSLVSSSGDPVPEAEIWVFVDDEVEGKKLEEGVALSREQTSVVSFEDLKADI